MSMNFLNDEMKEIYFEDIAYNLDDYIATSSCPKKEYASIIIPFFIDCMNHIHSELYNEERAFLLSIQSYWNLEEASSMIELEKLREKITKYEETLPFNDLKHRYLCATLEHLTWRQYNINDEVSPIWLFISGLLRSGVPLDSWLNEELQKRFSGIIKKQ